MSMLVLVKDYHTAEIQKRCWNNLPNWYIVPLRNIYTLEFYNSVSCYGHKVAVDSLMSRDEYASLWPFMQKAAACMA